MRQAWRTRNHTKRLEALIMTGTDDDLCADLNAAYDAHEYRRGAEYDGVLGTLNAYRWIPSWHKEAFIRVRNALLDKGYSTKSLQQAIAEWRVYEEEAARDPEQPPTWTPTLLMEAESVSYLALLRAATEAGKQAGQKMLGDSAGHKLTRSASDGGKQRNATRRGEWAAMQTELDRLRIERPRLKDHERRTMIAKLFGKSIRTVRDRTN